MTGPVWDGRGRDPWLPARLDARLEVAVVERDIRAAVWSALSDWLVQTARRVLRGDQPPDLDAIWARVPAWREAVDLILSGEVFKALSLAFAKLLGKDYPWSQRPEMTRYLAEVRNRLVRVPDEVFSVVAGQIAAGANLGESIPKLAARVDNVLSTTGSERWPNRAVVIARTETIGALNASRADAFNAVAEADPDTEYERIWLSTDDRRTRPTHDVADGQRVPLGAPFLVGGFPLAFPGDPTGPPQEVIQCVPADTLVWFPSVRGATRRWYEGDMVTLSLATGDQLTITPNHPVLRADGLWIAAGEIQEGDYCVRRGLGRHGAGQPDEDRPPVEIGQLYESSSLATVPQRVPLAPPDLHGDRAHGDVEVVPVDGDLVFHGQPATDQQVRQFGLSLAGQARVAFSAAEGGSLSGFTPGIEADQALALPGHPDAVGLAGTTDREVHFIEAASDDLPTDVEVTGHSQDAVSPVVSLAEVVKVDRVAYVGHVFNLDTGRGWYSANSIITRNCRCTMLLVEPGEFVDLSNRQFRRGR